MHKLLPRKPTLTPSTTENGGFILMAQKWQMSLSFGHNLVLVNAWERDAQGFFVTVMFSKAPVGLRRDTGWSYFSSGAGTAAVDGQKFLAFQLVDYLAQYS